MSLTIRGTVKHVVKSFKERENEDRKYNKTEQNKVDCKIKFYQKNLINYKN